MCATIFSFAPMLSALIAATVAASGEDAQAVQELKLSIWQRGIEPCGPAGCSLDESPEELLPRWSSARQQPVLRLRGGADGCAGAVCEPPARDMDSLIAELGHEFAAALEQNERDHQTECDESCEHFYCGDPSLPEPSTAAPIATRRFSLGSVPPEDFASDFNFPLDLIHVTSAPLIPPSEAEAVVAAAVADGVYNNEFPSGKYRLGGDWVKNLPSTLAWFNTRLRTTIFPAAAAAFPEIVSSAAVLRAHSVAVLKYNASHPRTDVHVDDGILALTLALSPRANYTGGGTFYEHMGAEAILEMEQGECTLRPGSVRHGGHPVTAGDRYILGAFLLIADRVEHVRRLNNQGRAARSKMDLPRARKLFRWALKINPQCATCLKNWAEAISYTPEGVELSPKFAAAAEDKLRQAVHLLPDDSDGWFSLGVLLSKMGRKPEAITAYERSVAINGDDHELLYNLAVLLGDVGRAEEELETLRRAIQVRPTFAKAWANLGVALAAGGDLAGAGEPFKQAVANEASRTNLINLARWLMATGDKAAAQGVMAKAKAAPS